MNDALITWTQNTIDDTQHEQHTTHPHDQHCSHNEWDMTHKKWRKNDKTNHEKMKNKIATKKNDKNNLEKTNDETENDEKQSWWKKQEWKQITKKAPKDENINTKIATKNHGQNMHGNINDESKKAPKWKTNTNKKMKNDETHTLESDWARGNLAERRACLQKQHPKSIPTRVRNSVSHTQGQTTRDTRQPHFSKKKSNKISKKTDGPQTTTTLNTLEWIQHAKWHNQDHNKKNQENKSRKRQKHEKITRTKIHKKKSRNKIKIKISQKAHEKEEMTERDETHMLESDWAGAMSAPQQNDWRIYTKKKEINSQPEPNEHLEKSTITLCNWQNCDLGCPLLNIASQNKFTKTQSTNTHTAHTHTTDDKRQSNYIFQKNQI